MTVSSQYAPVIFVGDGIQREWPVNFRIFHPAEVKAGIAGAYGLVTPLEYGADYTVTTNPGGLGGTVARPVSAGAKLVLWQESAIVQEDNLTPTGPLDAESLMFELDRGAIIDQQLAEGLARAVKAPAGSGKTGDEYALELFTARDAAEASAARAESEADRAKSEVELASAEADRSREEGDKVRELLDAARLSSLSRNLRATLALGAALASGATLTLPVPYYPGRDILYLAYNGVVCTPRKAGAAAAGVYQYEEVGDNPNEFSDKVKIYFAAAKGATFDVWVVASNLIREMEKLETMAALAETNALNAAANATVASNSSAAAQTAQAGAETAKTAAQTARGAAEAANSAAANSAADAAASASGAAASAATAASEARGILAAASASAVSAANAANSAGIASAKATEADNSALNAAIAQSMAHTSRLAAEAAWEAITECVASAAPAIIAEGDNQVARVKAEGNLQALRLTAAIEAALATAAQLTEVLARVAHMELHIAGLEQELAELKAGGAGSSGPGEPTWTPSGAYIGPVAVGESIEDMGDAGIMFLIDK